MIAKLIARTGQLAGQDFPLPDTARIGAAKEAEVRIRLDGVSRNHARMYRDGEAYWLEDAGSTNGTFLNGQRVQRERLRHLDVITLGRNVDLIFLCRAGDAPASAARPGVLNASFAWLDGPDSGATVDVPRGELTVGRAGSCNVVVESAAVSKVHARLVRSADQVTIQDLGSANGTFVNGRRVPSVMVLADKDRVGLAGVRSFQMRVERDPASAAALVTADSAPGVTSTVFNQEWKTRLVWSPEEMQELEAARQQARAVSGAVRVAEPVKPKPATEKAAVEKPTVEKPARAAGPPPPPPRAAKPADPGAAPPIKAPPPVPPRVAKPDAPAGAAKGPPPLPPRAVKPEAAAGEAKAPPPLPPRASPAGEVKGPPPLPPRAAVAGGEVKGPPPLPPRAKPAEGAGAPPPPAAAVKPPPPLPPRPSSSSGRPESVEGRNPPPAPGVAAAAQAPGAGASGSVPAPPGAQPLVPRPDEGELNVPAPHTSQPPPERRTGPQPAQVRPVAPNEGKPIRAVRLMGAMGTFTLEQGTYSVGRSEKAEIRLDDREVSRAHAIVIVSATTVTVEDQTSANGTFVNGVEVASRSALRHGDKVMFGSLEFSVQIEA